METAAMCKARGWASLTASVFIVAVVSVIWYVVTTGLAALHVRIPPPTLALLGQVAAGFTLFIIAGLLGIGASVVQIHSGRRNKPLSVAMVMVMIAAIGTIVRGAIAAHP